MVISFHWCLPLLLFPYTWRTLLPTMVQITTPSPVFSNSMNATNAGRGNRGSKLLLTHCIDVSNPAQFFLYSPSLDIFLLSGLHLKTCILETRSNMKQYEAVWKFLLEINMDGLVGSYPWVLLQKQSREKMLTKMPLWCALVQSSLRFSVHPHSLLSWA